MNKQKKTTMTIGIPAHNEEANIENMINSVLKQSGKSFLLEKVLVVLDGCTDNTLRIARSLAKKDRRIKVLHDGRRTGKATRLNQIYKLNKSQLIGTFDADIVLERDCELEIMVQEFLKNKKVNVVAGRQIPTPSNTWMGKFSNASFRMLQLASMKWRGGNNIHSLQGSSSILTAKFANSIQYPADTGSDQGYLYISAIKNGKSGFTFAKNTKIIFRAPNTFEDWRKLSARTITYDRKDIAKNFGKPALLQYKMPKKYIFTAILSVLLQDPISAIGAILMNVYIRIFHYSFKEKKTHTWEITKSSKASIKI